MHVGNICISLYPLLPATHKHTYVSRKLHEELRHIFQDFRNSIKRHSLPASTVCYQSNR